MVREKVNLVFNSRVFRLVFSLLVAIALWLYVEYSENEDIPSSGIRVAVEFLNPEIVADRNLIISEYRTENITLEFSGKRSTIGKLRNSGAVIVTADLADIKQAGPNSLQYTVTYGDGINQNDLSIISRSDNYVIVVVENAVRKEIPIVSKVDGQLAADGYQAETLIFTPETIWISGPQSEVERVTSARVNVQRENLTKTVTADMAFTLIDEDGEEVVSDFINADRESITVVIPIRMIKDIPLTANFSFGAGATVENMVVTISPEAITVSGEPELLNSMNSLPLTTIDLTMFDSYYTTTVPIILPNDITNVTGITEAEITISIRGLETANFSVPLQNVQFVNETPGYTTSAITSKLDVTVRGKAEELALITEDNIRIIVDMFEFGDSTGIFTPAARVRVDGDGASSCGAIGEYMVTVRVSLEEPPS